MDGVSCQRVEKLAGETFQMHRLHHQGSSLSMTACQGWPEALTSQQLHTSTILTALRAPHLIEKLQVLDVATIACLQSIAQWQAGSNLPGHSESCNTASEDLENKLPRLRVVQASGGNV